MGHLLYRLCRLVLRGTENCHKPGCHPIRSK
jgi:hypothetical protein